MGHAGVRGRDDREGGGRLTATASRTLLFLAILLTGCIGEARHTTTPRAAAEMLLVTNSGGRAVQEYDVRRWKGRAVAIDATGLAPVDKGYLLSALREHLSRGGALLVDEPLAEVVLAVRTAGHSINDPEWRFGVPPLPIGVQDVFTQTPDITVGYDPQVGWAKLQVWARDARTGEHLGRQVVWGRSRTSTFGDTWPPTDYSEYVKDRPFSR